MPLIATPKTAPLDPVAMQKRIAELEAQVAGKHAAQPLKFKVSPKGAVSVYNLNARFPVTLYGDQWERLLQSETTLRAFIVANKGQLSVK